MTLTTVSGTRRRVIDWIEAEYGVAPDAPWMKDPDSLVFRHPGNSKWFALLMTVPGDRVGLAEDTPTDILNVKADPLLIDSLCREPGFSPAYHMSKRCWLTVLLNGGVDMARVSALIDRSYELTHPRGAVPPPQADP